MAYQATLTRNMMYELVVAQRTPANTNTQKVSCDWRMLRAQLLEQWDELSEFELEATGRDRRRIAALIQRKYGISTDMAETYLYNFERTLPLLGCA